MKDKFYNLTDIKGCFTLSNGIHMPYLGLGVYLTKNGAEVINAVKWAIDIGYRHIDTAAIYRNEEGVSEGIKASGVPREEIFVTSKVWNSDQGHDSTLKAFDESLKKLDMDYLDLYLVHWPVKEKYKDTWKALERLYEDKRVRAIGVSNFLKHHLEDLMLGAKIKPMVDQLEFHPYLVQPELLDFCKKEDIQYEAWSPLMQGKAFDVQELKSLAEKYTVSVAQLLIRWNLQKGVITIPKSVHKERIAENANVFHFGISEDDMKKIDGLDRNHRVGPDPDNFDF